MVSSGSSSSWMRTVPEIEAQQVLVGGIVGGLQRHREGFGRLDRGVLHRRNRHGGLVGPGREDETRIGVLLVVVVDLCGRASERVPNLDRTAELAVGGDGVRRHLAFVNLIVAGFDRELECRHFIGRGVLDGDRERVERRWVVVDPATDRLLWRDTDRPRFVFFVDGVGERLQRQGDGGGICGPNDRRILKWVVEIVDINVGVGDVVEIATGRVTTERKLDLGIDHRGRVGGKDNVERVALGDRRFGALHTDGCDRIVLERDDAGTAARGDRCVAWNWHGRADQNRLGVLIADLVPVARLEADDDRFLWLGCSAAVAVIDLPVAQRRPCGLGVETVYVAGVVTGLGQNAFELQHVGTVRTDVEGR